MSGTRSRFDELMSARRRSVAAECWDFLAHNKKWWLLPILIVFLLFGILMVVGSSSLAPFIYPLF
jgi:hypothetical protein